MAEPRLSKLPPDIPAQFAEAFLELTERAVSFFPAIARLCGGVQAGVMCCQGLFYNRMKHVQENDRWFARTAQQWEEETCLSRREQDTAKAILKKKGFMETDLRKLNGAPTLHFRMNYLAIIQAFLEANTGQTPCTDAPNGLHQNAKSDCTDQPNGIGESVQTMDCTDQPNGMHENAKSYKEVEILKKEGEKNTENGFPASAEAKHQPIGYLATLEAIKQSTAKQRDLYQPERLLLDTSAAEDFNSIEVAIAICGELGLVGDKSRLLMDKALVVYRVRHQGKDWKVCGEELLAFWREYQQTVTGKYKLGFTKFFEDGWFLPDKRKEWVKGQQQNGVDENGGYFDGDVYVTKEGKRLPGYVPPPSARRQAQ